MAVLKQKIAVILTAMMRDEDLCQNSLRILLEDSIWLKLPKTLCLPSLHTIFAMKLIIFALVQSTVCYQLQLPFVTPSVMPQGHFSSLSKRIPSLSTALPAAQSAVLFDCDGVIILTEELHRLAYNECWSRNELTFVEEKSGEEKPVDWSVDYYDELQVSDRFISRQTQSN